MKFQIEDKDNKKTVLDINDNDKHKFLKQKRSEGFECVSKGMYYNRKTKEFMFSSTHFYI